MSLRYGHTTSSAEEFAKRFPGARVVKSFNQQGAEVLRAPRDRNTRGRARFAASVNRARIGRVAGRDGGATREVAQ